MRVLETLLFEFWAPACTCSLANLALVCGTKIGSFQSLTCLLHWYRLFLDTWHQFLVIVLSSLESLIFHFLYFFRNDLIVSNMLLLLLEHRLLFYGIRSNELFLLSLQRLIIVMSALRGNIIILIEEHTRCQFQLFSVFRNSVVVGSCTLFKLDLFLLVVPQC